MVADFLALRWVAPVFLAFSALAGCQRYWVCDEPSASRTEQLPQRLSQTGLYRDLASETLADGVVPYRPRFALWSDGADKRRWISLPEGGVIDTTDMDDWRFPRGTKLWKEFSVAGQRVETRILFKSGASEEDWIALAYLWNAEQTDALAVPWGASDVGGDHDVPAAGECMACHGGRKGRVLGFSAIQLARAANSSPDTDAPNAIDLDTLISQNRLSVAPRQPLDVPGNQVEREALGYLHANCSHCHNQNRPPSDGARCFDPKKSYDFTLSVGALDSAQNTPTYRTSIGSAFEPGNPDGSRAIELISHRGLFKQMPPLATEHVDGNALANLRVWVGALP